MKFKCVFLSVSLTAFFFISGNLLAYSGGAGTSVSPYQIANVADFQQLSATPTDWDKSFILTTDINLSSLTFTQSPIAPDKITKFTGFFDGNNHIISNLIVNASSQTYIGLFGYIDTGGQIKNLGVENVNIIGSSYVGGLVGFNYHGKLIGCSATGSVSGNYSVGGLVGCNSGTITSCYSTVSVTGTITSSYVGGLVGYNSMGVNMAGVNESASITSCYSTGSVSGNSYVGGLVGYNDEGSLTSCYATESVSGSSLVGGLVGQNRGAVTSCYATGSVSGITYYVGGLVGENYGPLTSCYSTGLVSGTGTSTYIGGLEGSNHSMTTNCFWDIQTSGQTIGVGYGTSTGVAGKTTAEMKTPATFISAGWDFVGEIVNGMNDYWQIEVNNYPRLMQPAWTLWGDGTSASPYVIANASDIGKVWLNPSAYYCLGKNLDLTGISWSSAVVPGFAGVFDGQGFIISNLNINQPGSNCVGLFGTVYTGGQIKNLGVENVNIIGSSDVGGLVGLSYGKLTSCYSTGDVTGTGRPSYVGGLIGRTSYYSKLTSCYSTVWVTGTGNGRNPDYSCVGGLVGYNFSCTITSCYSTGLVSGIGIGIYVGGLEGDSDSSGTLTACFWDTQTSGKTVGVGSGISTGVTGKTTAEMKTLATFTSAGWDFYNTDGDPADWQMLINDYPHLAWETTPPSGSLQFKSSIYWITEDGGSIRIYVSRTGGSYGSASLNYATANGTATAGSDYTAKSETLNWSHGEVTDKYFDISITNDNTIENDETFTVNLSGISIGSPSQTTVTILKQVATYGGGSGTSADPYQIANVADFQQLSAAPTDWDKSFILTADINLTGIVFTQAPIAPDTNTSTGFQGTMFTGIFDANNHTISNLTINASTNYVGLFGYTNNISTIKNLGIKDVSITGNSYVGELVGYNSGTITSCYSAGRVSGYGDYVGGLVGCNSSSGMITSCYAGFASGWDDYVGGLVGYNSGTITFCFAGGANGPISVGGLVGTNSGTITSCYATDSVSGIYIWEDGNYAVPLSVGGLVGTNYDTITSCYVTVSVSGTYSDYGNGNYAGGLVGINGGTITSCYATGSVDGYEDVGGLVGGNLGTIASCYAIGWVHQEYNECGGLVGSTYGPLTDCFWDIQTSGKTFGGTVGTPMGATGKTTVQMKTLSTFTSAGWDFTATDGDPADWQMLVNHYPRMAWETIVKDIADLNGDGCVDYLDLAILAEQWLQPSGNPSADLNNDNIVNIGDFAIFATHWMDGPQYLVGYWKFNETNGNQAYDSSTYGNHGTLMNGTVWTGNVELSFDGTDDYVSVPDSTSLDITDEITISVWIYMTQYSTNWPKLVIKPYDMADTDPWELFNLDLGHYGTYPRFILTDGIPGGNDITVSNSSYVLTLGQWHNIVGTYDGTTSSLYVDGELIASGSGVINIGTNDMPLNIGGRMGIHGFKGLIDEVRIYNRAVTLSEIELLSQSR